MGKMTLEELRKLRDAKKKEIKRRETEGNEIQIVVGMGTCGIAAGAKKTLETFLDELDKRDLSNVTVKQTGCMGSCNVEPTVEVIMPEMPRVIYGNVNEEVARSIVTKHIIHKSLLNDHIQDKPSVDIIDNK